MATTSTSSRQSRDPKVARRMCVFYIKELDRLTTAYQQPDQRRDVVDEFEQMWRQIDDFHDWSVAHWRTDEKVRRYCIAFVTKGWTLLELLRSADELEQWVLPALDAAKGFTDANIIAQLTAYRGVVCLNRGGENDNEDAQQFFQSAADMFAEQGETSLQAEWLRRLAVAQRNAGNQPDAEVTFDHALDAARRVDDYCLQSAILTEWGNAKANSGRYREALDDFLRAETTFGAGGCSDLSERGDRYGYIGNARRNLGQYEDAEVAYTAAIRQDDNTHNHQRRGNHAFNLALVYRDLGELEQMRRYLREALAVAERASDNRAIAKTQNALGTYTALVGKYQEAMRLHEQGLNTIGRAPFIKAYIQADFAETHMWYGNLLAAREQLLPALEFATKRNHPLLLQQRLFILARIEIGEGNLDAAREHIVRARQFDGDENALSSRHKLSALHGLLLASRRDGAAREILNTALTYCDTISGYSADYARGLAHAGLYVLGDGASLEAAQAALEAGIAQLDAACIKQDTALQLRLLNADDQLQDLFAMLA